MTRSIPIATALMIALCCSTTFGQFGTPKQEQSDFRSIEVPYGKASELANTLTRAFPDLDSSGFTANDSIKRVYAFVPDDEWPEVEVVIKTILKDAERHHLIEEERVVLLRDKEMRRFEQERKKLEAEQAKRQAALAKEQAKLNQANASKRTQGLAAAEPDDVLKVFAIKHRNAEELFQLLVTLGYDHGMNMTYTEDEKLIVRGTAARVAKITDYVAELDQPNANKDRRNENVDPFGMGGGFGGGMGGGDPFGDWPKVFNETLRFSAADVTPEKIQRIRVEYEASENHAAKIAEKIRGKAVSNPEALKKVRAQLNDVVANAFEFRLKLQAMELAAQQKQLNQLQRRIQDRLKKADQIIERRVKELVEGDDWSWSSKTKSNGAKDKVKLVSKADAVDLAEYVETATEPTKPPKPMNSER